MTVASYSQYNFSPCFQPPEQHYKVEIKTLQVGWKVVKVNCKARLLDNSPVNTWKSYRKYFEA